MKIILTIPHASDFIPDNLLNKYGLSKEHMLKHIDYGVSEIYKPFDYKKIEAKVSRFVVDLNRERTDLSSDQGVIIRKDWDWNTVWKKTPSDDETEELLSQYYDPFYKELENIEEGSFVWDCHSMDSKGNIGGGDKGENRPDICIATGEYSFCPEEIAIKLKELFSLEGYDVRIDDPYKGLRANIMKDVSSRGLIGVEFEISKRIYMDEVKLVLDDEKIEKLRRVLNDAFDYISSLNHEDFSE